MKICNNCNREYDDNLNFCSKCGNALTIKPQEYFCPSCGKSLGESFDRFCPYCGCQFEQVHETVATSKSNSQNNTANAENVTFVKNSYVGTEQQASHRQGYFSPQYLFSFKGRRGRIQGFITGTILSTLLLGIIFCSDGIGHSPLGYVLFALGIAIFWAKLANAVKRVHDFDKSGVWLLICIVVYSIVGSYITKLNSDVWSFITLVAPNLIYLPKGTNGPNRYGL